MTVAGVVLVAVACFGIGALLVVRFAPPLAGNSVGRAARLLVIALAGSALVLLGIHVFSVLHDLQVAHSVGLHNDDEQIVIAGVRAAIFDAALLLGMAAIVHLLAPAPRPRA